MPRQKSKSRKRTYEFEETGPPEDVSGANEEESLESMLNEILDFDENEVGVRTRQMSNSQQQQRRNSKRPADSEVEVTDLKIMKPSNPMTIPLVVFEVMKYLKCQDLRNCRLVSKTWNACAVPILKGDHTPVVFEKPRDIYTFNRLMQNAGEVPYSSYKLQSRFTPRIERYFQTFGHAITSLEISSKPGKNWIEFNHIFIILKWMPRLRSLTLVNIDFPKVDVDAPVLDYASIAAPPPIVMEQVQTLVFNGWFLTRLLPIMGPLDMRAQQCILDVYNAAPNTKNLELNILRATIIQNFLVGICQFKHLEVVSIQSLSESDLAHIIRASNIIKKLKSLTMKEVHLNSHGETLLLFMETFKDTLEFLDLRALSSRGFKLVRFPLMNALKELRLDTFFTTDSFQIDPLDLKFRPTDNPFPVLNRLVVSQNVFNGLNLANYYSPTVTDVSLKMCPIILPGFRNAVQDENEPTENPLYDPCQAQMMVQLGEMFPNLKKLKVEEIRLSALRIVFRNLTKLEELEIQHFSARYGISQVVYLNQILTGLEHPNWLSRQFDNYRTLYPNMTMEAILHFIFATSPDSIRNMQNLKVLTFSGKQCIDESAVNLALLHLNPLDKLVMNANSRCFSDEALAELRKRHKMVQLTGSFPTVLIPNRGGRRGSH